MEIKHILCQPFTPEAKPFIERGLGTFAHDLLTLFPGYIGHDVATREAIRSQESFAKRLLTPGEAVELRMSAYQFQEFCTQWCETIYNQRLHGGLDNLTPAAIARAWPYRPRRISNVRALDILLMPAAGRDGIRTISKKGIKVDGRWYVTPEQGSGLNSKVCDVPL